MACALAVGCGGSRHEGQRAATVKAPPAPALAGPGRLVAIGAGRSLFLDCVGSGTPTVVLEAGLGANTFSWRDVQAQLGRTTRTCAYDRAGIGNSVARPGVHDARADLADLQALLRAAHLDPPYVLVGHSYGGLLARLSAQEHRQQTAGVVLVDAKGRDQLRRELAVWPRSQARPVRAGVDLATSDAEASRLSSLGDTPLAVITAGTHAADSRGMPPALSRALYRLWMTMQDELASLSSNHVHVVALRSDHWIPTRRFYRGSRPIG